MLGLTYAYSSYRSDRDADGAVRGYLKAVAAGDAARALSYGELPAGAQTFLTATVLHKQLRIAPIRNITIGADTPDGDGTRVPFSYDLSFGSGDLQVNDSVVVHKSGDRWKLDRVAVPAQLSLVEGVDRASLAGAAVPTDTTLLFPGAVPIDFDTPYLRLNRATESLTLDHAVAAPLDAELTPAAISAAQHQVAVALAACGKGGPATVATCPVPNDEFVPGSMSGTLTPVAGQGSVEIGSSTVGTISITGNAHFTGTYRMLDFNDVAHTMTGTLDIAFSAGSYAVPPLALTFTDAS